MAVPGSDIKLSPPETCVSHLLLSNGTASSPIESVKNTITPNNPKNAQTDNDTVDVVDLVSDSDE